MKTEFSSGGIVFRHAPQLEFLLIENSRINKVGESWWGFPKGHLEEGESTEMAAVREVEEETGIKSEILSKIGNSKYVVTKNNEKIFKIVTIFLMKYLSGEVTPQIEEVSSAIWLPFDEALKKLTFSTDKAFLKQANELI